MTTGKPSRALATSINGSRLLDPVLAMMRRFPLAAFAILACLFSWWTVPLFGYPLGSGVALAALTMVTVLEGRSGLGVLLRRIVQWRVTWKWYIAAFGLPILATTGSIFIAIWLGAPSPDPAAIGKWIEIPISILFLVLVPIFGPWEEPGFRGYGLSTASRQWRIWRAALVIGVIHVVWHLPLFLTGEIPAADVVLILAASLVFAWLVVGSGGSVLLAMLMHATNNAVSGEYASQLFPQADSELLGWARAGLWCLIALIVVVANRQLSSDTRSDSPETTGNSPVDASAGASSTKTTTTRPTKRPVGRFGVIVGAVLPIAMLVSGCGQIGFGEVIDQTREVSSFSRIEVKAGVPVTVSVEDGMSDSIHVIGNKSWVEKVVTEVQDGTLLITHSGGLLIGSEDSEIVVSAPTLDGLSLLKGAHMEATGTSDHLELQVTDGSHADLNGLIVYDLSLDVSGGSNVSVQVTDHIRGSLSGGSRVTISGDPSQEIDVSGGASISN